MLQENEEQFDKNMDTLLMDAFGLQSPQLIVGTLISFWCISGSGVTALRGGMATITALEMCNSVLYVYVSMPSFVHDPLRCLTYQLHTKKWDAHVKYLGELPGLSRLEVYPVAVRLEPFGTVQSY